MIISVVTITYNNFEELLATLDSLQDIANIEPIIINGGSCEKTNQHLKNSSYKFLSEPDEGISDAFNKGIHLATGDAIVFLNSGDTLCDKNYYEEAINVFNNEKGISFIYSDIIFHDVLSGNIRLRFKNKSLGRGMPYFHQTLIVKKDVFRKVGQFNKKFKIAMDYDFVARMRKAGIKGHYIEKATVLMDGSGVSFLKEGEGIWECFYSLKKHNLLNIENLLGISIRYLSYKIRITLLSLGAKSIVKKIKRIKHSP